MVLARAVVLRAGLVHVGDRREADFQALGGEIELLAQRGLGGLGGGQRLQLHQHVEVGRGGAGDQRIAGGLDLVVGRTAQRLLAAQRGEARAVVDHLLRADPDAARGAVALGIAGHRDEIDLAGHRIGNLGGLLAGTGRARARVACVAADLRKHRRTRLHGALAGGSRLRFGRGELRVVLPRELVDLHQVGRGRGRGQQGEGEGKYERTADHV